MAQPFNLTIITPDHAFYNEEIEMVTIHTAVGEMGVLYDHTPTTVALDSGICTIKSSKGEYKGVIHGGFAEIREEEVILLPDAAEWPNDIDIERAKRAKERAEATLAKDHDHEKKLKAEYALKRAETRLALARWQEEQGV